MKSKNSWSSIRVTSGCFRGRQVVKPLESPTIRFSGSKIREVIFSILFSYLGQKGHRLQDLTFLDVFAGSGILGFEALSRGCLSGAFCDSKKNVCSAILETIDKLDLAKRTEVYCCDARLLPKTPRSFSLLFLDPPYYRGLLLVSLLNLINRKWSSKHALIVLKMAHNEILYLPKNVYLFNERIIGTTKLLFAKLTS